MADRSKESIIRRLAEATAALKRTEEMTEYYISKIRSLRLDFAKLLRKEKAS
jgi:hypothetical protein